MKRLVTIIAMLFMMMQCVYAGTPIKFKPTNYDNMYPKNGSEDDISAELDGRTLIIEFHDNFGAADISVESMSGNVEVTTVCMFTPDNAYVTVPNAGSYSITITTSEGVFVGYFTTD